MRVTSIALTTTLLTIAASGCSPRGTSRIGAHEAALDAPEDSSCGTLTVATFDDLVTTLAQSRLYLTKIETAYGDAQAALDDLTTAQQTLDSLTAWLRSTGLTGDNPSAAYTIHNQMIIIVTALDHARGVTANSAHAANLDVRRALEWTQRAASLALGVGTRGGRCYMAPYVAGSLPTAAAPKLPPSCTALNADAISPLSELVSHAVDAAAADMAGHPDTELYYPKFNLDGARSAAATLQELGQTLSAQASNAGSASDAVRIQTALGTALVQLEQASHWATVSATNLASGSARDSFEFETQASDVGNSLAGMAARCALSPSLVNRATGVASAKVVDWSYLRMNEPDAVTSRLRAVQSGKAPRPSLQGLAADSVVDSLLAHDATWSSTAYSGTTTPQPWAGGSAGSGSSSIPVTQLFSPEYAPHALSFGELAVSERRVATLSMVMPSAGQVTATILNPFKLQPDSLTGRYYVSSMTSFSGLWSQTQLFHGQQKDQETLLGVPIDVKAGQELKVVVGFEAGPQDNDDFDTEIELQGFGWIVRVPLHAKVTLRGDTGFVLANVNDSDVRTLKGVGVDLATTLVNVGAAKTAVLSANTLPDGISFGGLSVPLAAGETKSVNLHFDVAPDAPDLRGATVALDLAAGLIHSQVNLQANVYSAIVNFTGSGDSDNVHYKMSVDVKSDGTWSWTGHMDDSSFWYGDFFDIGFGFRAEGVVGDDAEWAYHEATGTIGATLSGGPSGVDINQAGTSDWLAKYYFAVVDNGMYSGLQAQGNMAPLLGGVGWMLVSAGAGWAVGKGLDIGTGSDGNTNDGDHSGGSGSDPGAGSQ